jgi:hypothetical protein
MGAGGRNAVLQLWKAEDEEVMPSQRDGKAGAAASAAEPPRLAPVREDRIPAVLRAADRWVVWEGVWRHDPDEAPGGKWSKAPFCATTGAPASATDPLTWSRFEDAVEAMRASQGRFAGLGFVLTHQDRLAVVEVEDALADDGTLDAEAARLLERLDTYAEATPSGRGVRAFVEANLPPGGRRRDPYAFWEADRIVCVTGQRLDAVPRDVAYRQGAVEEVHADLFPPPPPRPAGADAKATPPPTDRELLELAFGGPSGVRVRALYHGDLAGTGMDRNGADLALCSLLGFYTGADPVRLDRLFRNSRLYRRKWDEPHYSDGTTYGKAVVAKALEGCLLFYTAPLVVPVPVSDAPTMKSLPRLPAAIAALEPAAPVGDGEERPAPAAAVPQFVPMPVVPSVLDGAVNPLAVAEAQGRAHGLAMSEKVLTAREAAEMLHISPRMLRRCVRPWKRFGDSPAGDRWLLSDLLHRLEN